MCWLMNKQPVYYMQTDSRWKNKPYRVTGENTTIGDSGCGTTCAAMLIETLTGKTFTPVDAAEWSMKRGYKALRQGTYYSYFVPQSEFYGLKAYRLNTVDLRKGVNKTIHAKAVDALSDMLRLQAKIFVVIKSDLMHVTPNAVFGKL